MVREVDGYGVNYKIVRKQFEDGIKRRTMFFEVGTDDKCSVNEELVFSDLKQYPDFDRDTLHISRVRDVNDMPCHIIMPPFETPELRTGHKKKP